MYKKALCDYYRANNIRELTYAQAQRAIEMKEKQMGSPPYGRN
jgi:hypothetical protein